MSKMWRLGWIVGALSGVILSLPLPAWTQPTPDTAPDRALGTTVVPLFPNIYGIRGGLRRGQNLFHSFQEFNVGTNQRVYFDAAAGIQNILTRVTGSNASQIFGTLGIRQFLPNGRFAASPANLFLINPNGILFGQGARLDVGGSFVATTTNGLKFGNVGEFSATDPQPPSELLTINPSAFFVNRVRPQPIIVDQAVLGVRSGQSLVLLGGDVQVNRGNLLVEFPQGGQIEIGSVAAAGMVDLRMNGNLLSLGFPTTLLRGDVSIVNRSVLDATAADRGDIAIQARNLTISRSGLLGGIAFGRGTPTSQAGDLVLDATKHIAIISSSRVASDVASNAIGNAGNIRLRAGSLSIQDGSQLVSSTFGTGAAGNVQIEARNQVLFQGTSADGRSSGAFSTVAVIGRGTGGNIEITTGNLEVRDGAQLLAATQGRGNAGNVHILARDRVSFQGASTDGRLRSAAFSSVEARGVGMGGNVEITTGSLEVRDGAQLIAGSSGRGNAGNVRVIARDRVLFQGRSADGRHGSSAFSSVTARASGAGGNVEITTGSLEVRDGAQLLANTRGRGNAGNVRIIARNRVLFEGSGADGRFPSTAASNVEARGRGAGGNVEITTGSLEVRDGAQLLANTRGRGNAGNVRIIARDRVFLDGTNPIDGRSSAILTDNGTPNTQVGTGSGGEIDITAPDLTVSHGAVIDAQTANNQLGGNIMLNLNQLRLLSGGQILSTSDGSGSAGMITVNASDQIRLSGTDSTYTSRLAQHGTRVAPVSANSGIYVRASSSGSAGNILLTTPRLILDQQGRIDAESASGNGGNIVLNPSQMLFMRHGSRISTNAGTAQAGGDGGNITIDSPNGFIVGVLRENSDITANAFTGSGGNVTITAQGIYGLKFQPRLTPNSDITASSEFGFSGTVTLNIPDTDPSRGFISLPVDLTDPTTQLDTRCQPGSRGYASSYIETGRGGVPQNPEDPLIDETVTVGWAEARTGRRTEEGRRRTERRPEDRGQRTEERNWEDRGQTRSPETEIIEAQAIGRDRQGHLWLVAKTNQPKQFVPPECQAGGR